MFRCSTLLYMLMLRPRMEQNVLSSIFRYEDSMASWPFRVPFTWIDALPLSNIHRTSKL